MSLLPDWLPPLALFDDYDGDWEKYLTAIYKYFKRDFIKTKPTFRGKQLGLKRHPVISGKEATFWHMISEGKEEGERLPDLRRCERIRWPRPIIENESNTAIKVWWNSRKRENRICLWFQQENYLVSLRIVENIFYLGLPT